MSAIEFDSFMAFCKGLQGQRLRTAGGQAWFTLLVKDDRLRYTVESTGKSRWSPRKWIERALEHYTMTESLSLTDYQHRSRHSSYLVALMKLYLDRQPEPEREPEPITGGKQETIHGKLKRKIKELGEILGKYATEEYRAKPYAYDVVWKEEEGLPRPSHVFEVQDKGAVDGALAKLQHARDLWRPKLFLIVTGERDRRKVDMLLEPFLKGTFHVIRKDTTVLTAEVIEEIHQALDTHREVVKQFLQS